MTLWTSGTSRRGYSGGGKKRPGETYLLSGEQLQISVMRSLVQQAAGIDTTEIKFPARLAAFVAPLAEFYYKITRTKPKFTRYSIETLRSNSGSRPIKRGASWDINPAGFYDTIKETVDWWKINVHKTISALRTKTQNPDRTGMDRSRREPALPLCVLSRYDNQISAGSRIVCFPFHVPIETQILEAGQFQRGA